MSSVSQRYDLPSINRKVRLVRRPSGIPLPDVFDLVAEPLAELQAGRFRVRNLYLSVDPVQRGWAASEAVMKLGDTVRSLAVGVVVESRVEAFHPGDMVYGFFGWQIYHDAVAADVMTHLRAPRLRLSLYAGVLGMPGITAHLALADLAPPKAGDLVLVSTAAGAVGSVVGQLARVAGAVPVGLTGSDDKVARCLADYGYVCAINYKTTDLPAALSQAAPAGFNIYFDNTGGPILDMALRWMAPFGRIVQCGTAATPSWSPPPAGWRNEREVLTRRLSWNGFMIFDHLERFHAAVMELEPMVAAGALKHDEDVVEGIDSAPGALERLFSGVNLGKALIHVG